MSILSLILATTFLTVVLIVLAYFQRKRDLRRLDRRYSKLNRRRRSL